jgi:CRISPR-associated protein Cas1
MGTMVLMVDRRGASLSVGSHDTLVVRHDNGPDERVGVGALAEVLVHGEVALSSAVLRLLAGYGVPLTCLPLRGGGCAAHLAGMPTARAALRHAQHMALEQPEKRLALARLAVQAKLDGADAVLAGFGHALPPVDLATAASLDALRGLEGAAAARYWAVFRQLLPAPWRFPGRQRHPAPDPVNALLSLGYTLLIAPACRLLHAAGLDPQFGFLHAEFRERPGLALDLIEAARSRVDAFVLRLLDAGELREQDFHEEAGQPRLTLEGRRRFYPAWYAGAASRCAPMEVLLRAWQLQLRN